ncbi:glycosyltransferase family 2 protein [Chryseobacterium sp. SIMBA_029]|uniref:glycosyltransferase family 2 protein n=1 Tax=Chryseobacterium sp. SIMBA_029 TaxID=3085772 RepID=UPI00397DA8C4
MRPLLSIAIATKDREKYCVKSIQSILSLNSDKIEITISDNSATPQVKNFIEELKSTNVKYRYDSGPVSSIENFNRAIELTTGKYIILIGDDDTILPKAIEIAEWADNNDIDSVCSKEAVTYYWPGALEQYPTGALIIPPFGNNIKEISLKKNLISLLHNGLQHYLLYPLPKTYHGIVKKDILEKIKKLTGHYYGGLSPDIYSSVAVSCIAKNHFQLEEPISVAGVCPTSTTAENFTGKHSGTLENIPHLRHREGYVFDKRIPKYYSVNTIWAESGLKALEELKEFELLKEFNIFYLLAQGRINNRKFISDLIEEETQKTLSENNISQNKYKIENAKSIFKIYTKKALNILNTKMSSRKDKTILSIENIQKVLEIYNS